MILFHSINLEGCVLLTHLFIKVSSCVLPHLAVRNPGRQQGRCYFCLTYQKDWVTVKLNQMPTAPQLEGPQRGFKMICGLTLPMQPSPCWASLIEGHLGSLSEGEKGDGKGRAPLSFLVRLYSWPRLFPLWRRFCLQVGRWAERNSMYHAF